MTRRRDERYPQAGITGGIEGENRNLITEPVTVELSSFSEYCELNSAVTGQLNIPALNGRQSGRRVPR